MLYDPHRRWAPRGICRWEDRNLFFAPGGQADRRPSPKTQALWNQAKEICAMCPVIKECARDTLGEEFGVFGGLDEHQRYLVRRQMSRAIKRWPEARRLAWAREIYLARKNGISWRTLQTQTGLTPKTAALLYDIWKKRLQEVGAKGLVVDLELPEYAPDQSGQRPFPDRPGRRHAWVRHRGGISDAWYRGETPDGVWVRVTVTAGRGQTHKWVAQENVRLYRPQAVVILNYVGRPDSDDSSSDPDPDASVA